MHLPLKTPLLSLSATLLTLLTASADWRTDIGWDSLRLYAGTSLPTGSGVILEMTEAGTNYMPDTAHSAFSGITLTNISNTSTTVSSHATTVGLNYYGATTSLLTGANSVGVRSADDFVNSFLGTSGSVKTSSAAVMSHAYIASASPADEVALNKIITRFDFFSRNSNVVNVVGMNNANSGTIPPLFGSAYNAISVGRSDGSHSHGSTPANYPGPGRQKPDIVSTSSSIATSYATGAVASAAALLHAKAILSGNADASHPDTIKACMLAGATKSEFPSWSQTSDQPLDATFGAGELNVLHGYRIIENPASTPGSTPYRGWSRNPIDTNESVTYSFVTPDYEAPLTLSATLIWQRSVSKSGGGQNTFYSYLPLANLRLELLSQSGSVIQFSDSALDNVEHIWNTQLLPNTSYSLKVSNPSNSSDFSLAWRVNGVAPASISAQSAGNNIDVNMGELMPSVPYFIQRSTNLADWTNVHDFTASTATSTWSDTSVPTASSVFYRLLFFEP